MRGNRNIESGRLPNQAGQPGRGLGRGLGRREAIVGTVAAGACALLPGCAGLSYVPTRLEGSRLVFAAASFAEQACVGLKHPRLTVPIAVCKLPDGALSAVSAECTHKACELRPGPDRLECPCHGSEFSFTGEVLKDPAKEDLRRFSVQRKGDRIYVGA